MPNIFRVHRISLQIPAVAVRHGERSYCVTGIGSVGGTV